MKKLKILIALVLFITVISNVNAQTETTQTDTFKVWGNCRMCKKTIEKSVKIKGISSAVWNQGTKMITVTFNPQEITLAAIHKKIAGAGYDTELETAQDEVYNKLHGCCQYERKK
jgi:copper chaperone CopZ